MIRELVNLIKSYLYDNHVIVPNGYENITEQYNFYNFLEDYLYDNWDDVITTDTYDIIDELPELCSENEPFIDTHDMDKKLLFYYNKLVDSLNESEVL